MRNQMEINYINDYTVFLLFMKQSKFVYNNNKIFEKKREKIIYFVFILFYYYENNFIQLEL